METLYSKSETKISQVSLAFTRYLLGNINPNNRISIIKGARGVGKTTLLLQYAKTKISKKKRVLYVAMDDLYFLSYSLYECFCIIWPQHPIVALGFWLSESGYSEGLSWY